MESNNPEQDELHIARRWENNDISQAPEDGIDYP